MSKFAKGKFNLKNPKKYIGKKTPTYRSSWEFAFCKFCDEHPGISQWASEAIQIPYRHPLTGKHTIYVPDFFISYVDRNGKQHAELIEVKPENQTIKERLGSSKINRLQWVINQVKWEAARSWCKQQGIDFRIVTEKDMFYQGRRR